MYFGVNPSNIKIKEKNGYIITDEFREDLKILVSYLTNESDLQWIYDYIDKYELEDEDDNDVYYSDFFNQDDFIVERKMSMINNVLSPEFMLLFDWKENEKELKFGIEQLIQNNFGIHRVKLPKIFSHIDSTNLIDFPIFFDFQCKLKKQGFNLARLVSYR